MLLCGECSLKHWFLQHLDGNTDIVSSLMWEGAGHASSSHQRRLSSEISDGCSLVPEERSSGGTQPSLSVWTFSANTLRLVAEQWWPVNCPSLPGLQRMSSLLCQSQLETLSAAFLTCQQQFSSFALLLRLLCTDSRGIGLGTLDIPLPLETATLSTVCLSNPEPAVGTWLFSSLPLHSPPPRDCYSPRVTFFPTWDHMTMSGLRVMDSIASGN